MLELEYYPESAILTSRAIPVNYVASCVYILEEMWHFMVANDGIGLAAPQVGISKRMFVTGFEDMKYVINAQILDYGSMKSTDEEGCLSLVLLRGDVKRSEGIRVRYTDMSGFIVTRDLFGLQARVFMHEYDHLDGWLFPFYKIPGAQKGFFKPEAWFFWNDWKLELMYGNLSAS